MRRQKLKQHCIEERSDELAVLGAISVESIFVRFVLYILKKASSDSNIFAKFCSIFADILIDEENSAC